jgi:hypothetical protein
MHCIHLSISLLPIVIDPVEQEREEPPECNTRFLHHKIFAKLEVH